MVVARHHLAHEVVSIRSVLQLLLNPEESFEHVVLVLLLHQVVVVVKWFTCFLHSWTNLELLEALKHLSLMYLYCGGGYLKVLL